MYKSRYHSIKKQQQKERLTRISGAAWLYTLYGAVVALGVVGFWVLMVGLMVLH